jgi:hypothetical protein
VLRGGGLAAYILDRLMVDPTTICYLADEECDGPLHDHHLVPRQRIRKRRDEAIFRLARGKFVSPARMRLTNVSLEAVLRDERNIVRCCDRHHFRVENGFQSLEMPLRLGEFLEEYGFTVNDVRTLRHAVGHRERADDHSGHSGA